MKNTFDFLIKNVWKVAAILFFCLFLMKGCTNNKIGRLNQQYEEKSANLEKKIDSLHAIVSTMATAKDVRDEMEIVMFNYLIYEDDLDKGKSSLSDVKNKIESND